MNAHNEQQGFTAADMADQYAAAFERGRESVLAELAAAAQEAVAYLDIGAGGYLDIGSDLPEEQLLALPNGRHALGIIGTYGIDGYVSAPVTAAPAVTDPVAAYERELAAGATHEHALHAICTPAAPGIDHAKLNELLHAAGDAAAVLQNKAAPLEQETSRRLYAALNAFQATLIDASPKVGHFVDATNMVDSPNGGSDDAALLDWMDANGFTAYRQIDPIDGLSGHCVVVHETMRPRRGNVHDTIRGAIYAAMQAQANSHGAGVSK